MSSIAVGQSGQSLAEVEPNGQSNVVGLEMVPVSTQPEITSMIGLKRTGKRSLRFKGTLIAEAIGWALGASLWHEVNLYRNGRGQYVANIRVLKKSPGDRDIFHAEVFDSLGEAAAFLEDYNPMADVGVDLDPGEDVDTADLVVRAVGLRQRREQARRDYDALIGDLFYQLDGSV